MCCSLLGKFQHQTCLEALDLSVLKIIQNITALFINIPAAHCEGSWLSVQYLRYWFPSSSTEGIMDGVPSNICLYNCGIIQWQVMINFCFRSKTQKNKSLSQAKYSYIKISFYFSRTMQIQTRLNVLMMGETLL